MKRRRFLVVAGAGVTALVLSPARVVAKPQVFEFKAGVWYNIRIVFERDMAQLYVDDNPVPVLITRSATKWYEGRATVGFTVKHTDRARYVIEWWLQTVKSLQTFRHMLRTDEFDMVTYSPGCKGPIRIITNQTFSDVVMFK